jgi:hypothetical protein
MDPSPAPGASTAAEVAAASVDPPAPDASSSAAASAAEDLAGSMAGMTLDERFDLLMRIGEECIQADELRRLLRDKPFPICYDGFEPSGRMHIAQVPYVPPNGQPPSPQVTPIWDRHKTWIYVLLIIICASDYWLNRL